MLAYGMSEFKLAGTLRIKVPEAKKLISDYFKAFPGIGTTLEFLGNFGLDNGYIQTIWPYYRRRWFPNWQFFERFIESHKQGVQYHPGLGEINRASMNQPKRMGCLNRVNSGKAKASGAMLILSQAA